MNELDKGKIVKLKRDIEFNGYALLRDRKLVEEIKKDSRFKAVYNDIDIMYKVSLK